ncbi:MAG: D-alanyl-D-alanine carboxypeptidase, partial [Chloroflexota bacterium]|nr:D-alanyl-D-alanine carboxypeptidase [Chloroflexota bacterium]
MKASKFGPLIMALVVAGCATATPAARPTATPTPTATLTPTATSTSTTAGEQFPTAAFADIGDGSVSEEVAVKFQSALDAMARGGGMAATVMTADGTWSGATGMANGVRAVTTNDQFAINSITKSVVAAQVVQLVENGELALDDPAAAHLPADVTFDTNGATIRQLLGMRSGIP